MVLVFQSRPVAIVLRQEELVLLPVRQYSLQLWDIMNRMIIITASAYKDKQTLQLRQMQEEHSVSWERLEIQHRDITTVSMDLCMEHKTAIYGTTQSDIGINVGGRYAGYFNGDVKVTGTLYAPVLTTTAASSNIATAQVALTEANNTTRQTVSDRLAQLSAVQYNISIPMPLAATSSATRAITSGDTIEVAYPTDIELQAIEKNHYGLMAAQLQQVYPDLVYENQQGDLCINYIEMIPLLVESIKELKAEINTLQSGNTGGAVVMSRASFGATDIEEATVLTIPMLKQNNPNPFTENTVIEYSLPESVQTANLYIYDMNGSQIQQITLTERGDSSITVNGGELNAGMYLYSLIADGKVIDTKRMILTK